MSEEFANVDLDMLDYTIGLLQQQTHVCVGLCSVLLGHTRTQARRDMLLLQQAYPWVHSCYIWFRNRLQWHKPFHNPRQALTAMQVRCSCKTG